MSLNEHTYTRSVYTSLDFLGDIGGLADALRWIGAMQMWLISGDSLILFLTSQLFKYDKGKLIPKETTIDNAFLKKTQVVLSRRKSIKQTMFPSPLCPRKFRYGNALK